MKRETYGSILQNKSEDNEKKYMNWVKCNGLSFLFYRKRTEKKEEGIGSGVI